MIIHKTYSDRFVIIAPQKQEINLNELNLIASGAEPLFSVVSLQSEKKKYILTYSVDQEKTVSHHRADLSFSDIMELLQAHVRLFKTLYKYRMKLSCVMWDYRLIEKDESGVRFVYLPFEDAASKLDAKRILIDQISALKSKDGRVRQLLTEIREAPSEGACMDVLERFIEGHTANDCRTAFTEQDDSDSEAESSFLSSEAETSFLSPEAESSFLSSEAETSFLSPEAETSFLSREEEMNELPEENPSGIAAESDDAGIAERSDGGEEYETTSAENVFPYGELSDTENAAEEITTFFTDSFSEGETTLLTESPLQTPGVPKNREITEGLYLLNCNTGERIPVTGNFFLIGKDPINMDYTVNNNTVSRHHATITFESGAYYMMDNKSTNGTTIEGVQLQPFEKVRLYDGALISMGSEYFQVQTERR